LGICVDFVSCLLHLLFFHIPCIMVSLSCLFGFLIKKIYIASFLSHVILFQDALMLWAPIIVLCYSRYFRLHCKGTFHLWKLGQFMKQWWKCYHQLWHMYWIKVMIISSLDMFCSLLYPHVVALWWSFPSNNSWKGMHLNKKMVLLLKRLKVENFKTKIHACIFLCTYILSGT
jgi:hypothetical protein